MTSELKPVTPFGRCSAVLIAHRLQELRANMSYAQIAARLGLNSETVRRYMISGKPSAEFLGRLAIEYGVDTDWVLTGRGAPFVSGGAGHLETVTLEPSG